jgi:hypothetical protein
VALWERIEQGSPPPTDFHAKVAAAAFEHGLELFVKGALVLAGERPGRTHNIAAALGRYRTLYPGPTYAFRGRVDEAARDIPEQPPSQFLRYPVDSAGVAWPGHSDFDLRLWLEQAQLFREDYKRLEPLLRERPT